ncbi:anti-sigma factor family protein [Paludibaculum fermentans]|uniref:anti-sigma factor family protein n=1 Tax=Paludibaculum fermentans TaxID=1473598 RepID=UPI003EB92025
MSNRMSVHVDEDQLLAFLDGELDERAARAVKAHLHECADCGVRLAGLRTASDGFAEWERQAVRPAAVNWPGLASRLDEVDQEHARQRSRQWGAAGLLALAASLVMGVVLFRQANGTEPTVDEVLARAEHSGRPARRNVRVSAFGGAVIRPAVLADGPGAQGGDGRVRAMFVNARYDWTEPLSAKAYLSWRGQLARRHDAVLVKGGPEAQDRTYIVRTETDASSLRTASLTLRGGDLRPIEGSFEFGSLGQVQISETTEPATPPVRHAAAPQGTAAAAREDGAEELRPEDALHVLAALNRAEADVGEPLELDKDAAGKRLVIRSTGLSEAVQRRVESELAGLSNVELRIQGQSGARMTGSSPEPSTQVSDQRPRTIVALLEERLGGPLKLQSVTEEVLEASGVSLARAHALEVLAQWIPGSAEAGLSAEDRRLLQSLRAQHYGALRDSVERMEGLLGPLVGAGIELHDTRQIRLTAAARRLNRDLSLLFAGSYNQAEGERAIRALRPDLQDLRKAIAMDSNARR